MYFFIFSKILGTAYSAWRVRYDAFSRGSWGHNLIMTAGGHRKVIHGSAPLPDCWLTPVKGGATVGIQVKHKVVGCNSKHYTGGALQIKRGIWGISEIHCTVQLFIRFQLFSNLYWSTNTHQDKSFAGYTIPSFSMHWGRLKHIYESVLCWGIVMRICSGYSLMGKCNCKNVLCSSVFVRKSKLSIHPPPHLVALLSDGPTLV